ncbi:unnamed protein product [Penicillium salamii]|nr:unnamed protein product [Penicillium salamii]
MSNRPRLPEEHFLNVVLGAVDVDVLLITGMKDKASVVALLHLVLDSRLLESLDCCPSFIFENDTVGSEAAIRFAKVHLLSFCDEGLQRLANMVRLVPHFPRSGVEFCYVLNISQ